MIRTLIGEHGGIMVLVTHPIVRHVVGERAPNLVKTQWNNTIICADGWTHSLTTEEEDELFGSLPPALCAQHHFRVDEDGRALPL